MIILKGKESHSDMMKCLKTILIDDGDIKKFYLSQNLYTLGNLFKFNLFQSMLYKKCG